MGETKRILIYCERTPDGEILPVVYQLITKCKEFSTDAFNFEISVVVLGRDVDCDKYKRELAFYGVNKVIAINSPLLDVYNTKNYAKALLDYLNSTEIDVFLIGATHEGRDLAPQISSALNTGLTADCTGLNITEEGRLAATRPTFGGELMATILTKTNPQMATVRPNVFKAIPLENFSEPEIEYISAEIPEPSNKILVKRIEKMLDADSLENAKIILVGGKGLKEKENFDKLYKLAEKLNAQVGATRKAVDAGFAPQSIQIGQTGKTVSPKLYISFGVSGAIQHCVGIQGAKQIIAINNDSNAPIVQQADKTIIADAVSVIDEWLLNS